MSEARMVYDAVVERYVEWAGTQLFGGDRRAARSHVPRRPRRAGPRRLAGRPVADLGCGPGRAAAHLAAHGLGVIGVDAAPAMLAAARRAHPGIGFAAGTLAHLPVRSASLAGAVCWYSIIHTPPERLGDVTVEPARVLAPDAPLLVAFQAGHGEGVRRDDAFDTGSPLTSYRHSPDAVSHHLTSADFRMAGTTVRDPQLAPRIHAPSVLLARSSVA